MEASFYLPYTLCFNEIWVTPKTRILPSGTLSRMLDLENFASAAGRCVLYLNNSVKTDDDRVYLSHQLRRSKLRDGNSVTARCWQ